jgi:hypothetical protein
MNPNPYERTMDERLRVHRNAKKARGLHKTEQQTLLFIADAAIKRRGVCSQSLRSHVGDYGYSRRSLQYGLRGRMSRERKGEWEYIGLLARGIVYLAGGHPKGGRNAGGVGLVPEYAINFDVLLQYVPESTPPEKGAPDKGAPKPDKGAPDKGAPTDKGALGHPSTTLKAEPVPTSDIAIFPTAEPAPSDSAAVRTAVSHGDKHATRCSSKPAGAQKRPPTAVTCKQVSPSGSASDEQRMGLQLQAAVLRIAKRKLGNHRHFPKKTLTGKFERLVIAHGVAVVSDDFEKWCDEDPPAKRAMTYPMTEYAKVVDDRFGGSPAEDLLVTEGLKEIGDVFYELTNTLLTKRQQHQIAELLKTYPLVRLQDALKYFIARLPEDPTPSDMRLFWTARSIAAVLKAESKMREATEDGEEIRTGKPMRDLQALKRNVGTLPFNQRLVLSHQDYSSCPFHDGDSDTSFHVTRTEDGVGLGTCFSTCAKTFDAIAFVEKFDHVSTGEAIRKLVLLAGEIDNGVASAGLPPKPKPSPMTEAAWAKSGRAVTDADVTTLAASRPNSVTPSAVTLNAMGFKMGNDVFLSAPYRLGDTFYTVKGRNITVKRFLQENAVSQHGLFNIDAVTAGCDVFVVESELDAAVLHEHGFIAVSVINAQQRQIEPAIKTRLLTAGQIILIGDADKNNAGQKCMTHLAGLLPAEKVHRMVLPAGVKDVGEWATSAQFPEQFASAIQNTLQTNLVGAKS